MLFWIWMDCGVGEARGIYYDYDLTSYISENSVCIVGHWHGVDVDVEISVYTGRRYHKYEWMHLQK